MKSKLFLSELAISIIFIILLFLLVNPLHFWMPTEVDMLMVLALVVVFGAFAVFVFQEKAVDERESFIRNIAGRYAFLFGAGILVIAVVMQTLSHQLDNWLVLALSVMILAKMIGIIYGRIKY